MAELAGRVAVVLGGGSIGPGWGIGKAISVEMAKAGAFVAVADREAGAARETLDLIQAQGGRASADGVDVCDDEGLTGFLHAVLERHGRIDILQCNVGLGKAGPSQDTTAAEWRHIADANLTSLHVACSAVLPAMRERRSGVILATSSVAGTRDLGYPHLAYGATKAAAIQFMRLTAIENAPFNIRANTVLPGLVDTPRIARTLARSYDTGSLEDMKATRAAQVPLGRMASAFDVAHACLFLASDRAGYITGTELVVDGGLSATVNRSPYA